MRKLALGIVLVLVASSGALPVRADGPALPGPSSRAAWFVPKAPGTVETFTLQWGPYPVGPGSDLIRPEKDVIGADGFVVSMTPSIRLPDGNEPSSGQVHVHHAGWNLTNSQFGPRWLGATGEEQTHIDFAAAAKADPRYADGLRYGFPLHSGDQSDLYSMIHNKSSGSLTLFLQLEMKFVYGTRDAIQQATGLDYHPLSSVLYGTQFNVSPTGGDYVFPRDLPSDEGGCAGSTCFGPFAWRTSGIRGQGQEKTVRGLGQVWTAPWDGTVLIGAGHLHPGAREIVVSNLGSEADPCPDEGDGFAGTTVARLREFTRNNVFPSEEFQIGITKPGWRVVVRKGDRLSINAVYDAAGKGWLDAMSFFGFWTDTTETAVVGDHCAPVLIDDAAVGRDATIESVPNRDWHDAAERTCTACDAPPTPRPPLGAHATTMHVAGFQYVPGDLATSSITGVPWVRRGETLTVVNDDYALGFVRHSLTSCRAPCDGTYVANYPLWDGVFESGVLGMGPTGDTYMVVRSQPVGSIDTTSLQPGYYTFFCRLHPFMRGAFSVEAASPPPPPGSASEGAVTGAGRVPDGRQGRFAYVAIAASRGSGVLVVRDAFTDGDRYSVVGTITSTEFVGSTATVNATCMPSDGGAGMPCVATFHDRGPGGSDDVTFSMSTYSVAGALQDGDVAVASAG